MRADRRVYLGATVSIASVALLALAAWRPPERLAFLDERAMRLLLRAEAPTTGRNGQYPVERVYAVDGSPKEIAAWLDSEAQSRGLSRRSGVGSLGRWTSDDGETVVEVSLAAPPDLAVPDPLPKAYLVAVEPQPNPALNRAYHWVKRKWYRERGAQEPDGLPRDLPL